MLNMHKFYRVSVDVSINMDLTYGFNIILWILNHDVNSIRRQSDMDI